MAKIISKSFIKFTTIEKYCCAYQEKYNDIASWLANKNRYKNQIQYYKVLLQKTILDKLSKAYALFISTIDKNWLNYIYVDLRNTIYQIIQYLKKNFLKILRIAFTTYYSIKAYPNKRQGITSSCSLALLSYKQLVCFSKKF